MNQSSGINPKVLVGELDRKLAELVSEVESASFYQVLLAEPADLPLIQAFMKHIYLSIYQYQPHVTEATFTAVGRMPKSSEQLIKEMILQQVEEVEHADMARRDYEQLGGDEQLLHGKMYPACAAVAASVRFLGEHCPPACYLGFMYIFEALTPIMASRAQMRMDQVDFHQPAREFVDLHAVEDLRHTDMIKNVIVDLVRLAPETAEDILFGFDSFRCVYPLPLWNAAFARARAELAR